MNSSGGGSDGRRLEGWLWIEDPLAASKWNKRYCVVSFDEGRLYFYESEEAKEAQTSQQHATVVHVGDDILDRDGARPSRLAVERSARASLERPTLPDTALSDSEEYRRLSTTTESSSSLSLGGRLRASLRRGKSSAKKTSSIGPTSASEKDKDKKSGSFQRSKSLSRNEGRLYRNQLAEARPLGRSLDSFDSLTPLGEPNTSIELTGKQAPTIRVLHASIAPREHCFDVLCGDATLRCRCADEPQMKSWLDGLGRCVNRERDNDSREEIDVTFWIMDSKGMPKKKNYYCEIFLDDTLYARTTTKLHGDSLFWGEHFSFGNVEVFNMITVRMYKDTEKKRKGPTLVGKVLISVSQFDGKSSPLEKWHPIVGSHKLEQATIRIKTKYQVVPVLALKTYDNFLHYLQEDYSVLCQVLEPIIPAKEKDEIAQTLIRIVNSCGKSHDFLMDIVMTEVHNLEDENLIFRGNTFATKAMDTYMKLVGEKYLRDTVGAFIRYLYESDEECEVDPSKLPPEAELRKSQETLVLFVEKAWAKIVSSYPFFPVELQEVFHGFRVNLGKEHDTVAKKLISGSIFLRFFCPAILSPSLFHLMQAYPDDKTSRKLTLVAKVLQSLANFTRFGAKEDYMFFMDEFLEREIPNMVHYIDKISSPLGEAESVHSTPANVDLGRELAIMHRILVQLISRLNKADMERVGALPLILHSISQSAAAKARDPSRRNDSDQDLTSLESSFEERDRERAMSPSAALTSPTNEGRHPSLLHSIRQSRQSPARAFTAPGYGRRVSSPVLLAKHLHPSDHRVSGDGGTPQIAVESGSDSSGSSGHGSPQRFTRRSLPQTPPSVSLQQTSPVLRPHSAKLAMIRSSSSQHPSPRKDASVKHSASSHVVMTSASSHASLASKESFDDTSSYGGTLEAENAHLREELYSVKSELRENQRAARSLQKELDAAKDQIRRFQDKEVEMRRILERVVESEDRFRREKRELQEILSSKQQHISLQENRIRGLDVANARLLSGLEDLHEISPRFNGATSAGSPVVAASIKEMKEKFEEGGNAQISADLQEMIHRLQNPGAQSPEVHKALRAERREKRRSRSNPMIPPEVVNETIQQRKRQSGTKTAPVPPMRRRVVSPLRLGPKESMSPQLAAMIQELKNTGSEFV